jgi:hypothetical protein
VADDIGQAKLSVQISLDGYDWVVKWVTNDRTLRSELRKVDLGRCQVDLAKAFKNIDFRTEADFACYCTSHGDSLLNSIKVYSLSPSSMQHLGTDQG